MPRRYLADKTGQITKVIALRQRRHRQRYGQALVEGPQAVRELLSFAPQCVRDLYVTEAGLAAHPDIDELAAQVDPYTHVLPEDVFAQISTDAQGLAAVMNIPAEVELGEFFAAKPALVVCLVESADPGNLGTIIRTADAAGADGVVLGHGSVELYNPKVIRSTAGSLFHLPVVTGVDVGEVAQRARASGMRVLAADGSGSLQIGSECLDLSVPTLWLIGNEAHGLSGEHLGLADDVVRIPLWGHAESLNAAVAASLCIYASAAAQRGQFR
ncbi:TrmH family RNA methyltransferase [Trueperella bialowiezensis]|uniref:TrmH family tRNA/rRNA methyltransferase n=1 Tax=Trueperella bialowiezensis TaxID=312285 RepID=A0A3S4V883_9ACTO|nr:RNA methyltransferase [Trueperella bialowiezensis]VEI14129.1 Putative TrmH family tRNA/rRNA methyltransferase [Trueperella bialowiezensis]